MYEPVPARPPLQREKQSFFLITHPCLRKTYNQPANLINPKKTNFNQRLLPARRIQRWRCDCGRKPC